MPVIDREATDGYVESSKARQFEDSFFASLSVPAGDQHTLVAVSGEVFSEHMASEHHSDGDHGDENHEDGHMDVSDDGHGGGNHYDHHADGDDKHTDDGHHDDHTHVDK